MKQISGLLESGQLVTNRKTRRRIYPPLVITLGTVRVERDAESMLDWYERIGVVGRETSVTLSDYTSNGPCATKSMHAALVRFWQPMSQDMLQAWCQATGWQLATPVDAVTCMSRICCVPIFRYIVIAGCANKRGGRDRRSYPYLRRNGVLRGSLRLCTEILRSGWSWKKTTGFLVLKPL